MAEKPILVIYRGLPASGKTTLARAWVAEDPAHRARSNRDDLRRSLHDGVYLGHDTERQIIRAQDSAIRALLEGGVSVACDDTNLSQKRARHLAGLALEAAAGVEVRDLTDVSVEVCVARDRDRPDTVGADVIQGMARKYLHDGVSYPLPLPYPAARPAVNPYVARPDTPTAILVDLDGTLCLQGDRSPYDESRVAEDIPNGPVVETVLALRACGYLVVFMSGRTEGCRTASERWIDEHVFGPEWYLGPGKPYENLFMRQEGDTRKDAIVKRELFDAHIRDRYDVHLVFDDRQQVVDMWRDLGLTVFQVAPGNF